MDFCLHGSAVPGGEGEGHAMSPGGAASCHCRTVVLEAESIMHTMVFYPESEV